MDRGDRRVVMHIVSSFTPQQLALEKISGASPLQSLIQADSFDEELFTLLVEKRIGTESVNFFGEPPLFFAVQEGREKEARLLVDLGSVSVNRPTEPWQYSGSTYSGRTALHIAGMLGHTALVKFLLQRGADAGMRDADNLTPGMLTAKSYRRAQLRKYRKFFSDKQRDDRAECLRLLEEACIKKQSEKQKTKRSRRNY